MSTKIRAGVFGFAVGLGAGVSSALVKLFFFTDEDRPAIRVKNAEVTFEGDHDWIEVSSQWEQDHSKGEDTDYFVVTIDHPPPSGKELKMLVGTDISIVCQREGDQSFETFVFHSTPNNNKRAPKLRPFDRLTKDGSNPKKLFFPDAARIVSVKAAGGGERKVSGNNIKITVKPHHA